MYQMKVNRIYKVKSTTHGQKCYSTKTFLSIKSKVPVYNGQLSLSRKKKSFLSKINPIDTDIVCPCIVLLYDWISYHNQSQNQTKTANYITSQEDSVLCPVQLAE